MISYEQAIEIAKKKVRKGYTLTSSYENDKFWIFTIYSDACLKDPKVLDGVSEISIDKQTGKPEWSAIVQTLDIFLPEEYKKLEKTYKKLGIKCEGSD